MRRRDRAYPGGHRCFGIPWTHASCCAFLRNQTQRMKSETSRPLLLIVQLLTRQGEGVVASAPPIDYSRTYLVDRRFLRNFLLCVISFNYIDYHPRMKRKKETLVWLRNGSSGDIVVYS